MFTSWGITKCSTQSDIFIISPLCFMFTNICDLILPLRVYISTIFDSNWRHTNEVNYWCTRKNNRWKHHGCSRNGCEAERTSRSWEITNIPWLIKAINPCRRAPVRGLTPTRPDFRPSMKSPDKYGSEIALGRRRARY